MYYLIFFIMKKKDFELNEENLLETFEVEELEKRYEMGWGSGSVSGSYGSDGWYVGGSYSF